MMLLFAQICSIEQTEATKVNILFASLALSIWRKTISIKVDFLGLGGRNHLSNTSFVLKEGIISKSSFPPLWRKILFVKVDFKRVGRLTSNFLLTVT